MCIQRYGSYKFDFYIIRWRHVWRVFFYVSRFIRFCFSICSFVLHLAVARVPTKNDVAACRFFFGYTFSRKLLRSYCFLRQVREFMAQSVLEVKKKPEKKKKKCSQIQNVRISLINSFAQRRTNRNICVRSMCFRLVVCMCASADIRVGECLAARRWMCVCVCMCVCRTSNLL